MDISLETFGIFFLIWLISSIAAVSFLAKRKSKNVYGTIALGSVLSLIPLFGLVFLVVLYLKPDLVDQREDPGQK